MPAMPAVTLAPAERFKAGRTENLRVRAEMAKLFYESNLGPTIRRSRARRPLLWFLDAAVAD